MTTPVPMLLTRKAAAKTLGISVSMLDRLARQGVLEPIRLSQRKIFFRRQDIELLTLPPSKRRAFDDLAVGSVQ